MKYLINLTSKSSGRARFIKIEADDIKNAEWQAGQTFPTYEISRICEDEDHHGWYTTVSRMRRNDE